MNNSIVRTISGTVMVVLVVACLMLSQYLFAALIIFVMSCMLSEFYRMTMGDKYKFSRMLAILTGIIAFLLVFSKSVFGFDSKYISLCMVPISVIMFDSLLVKDKSEFFKFAYLFTGLLYIAVPMTLSNLIVFETGEFSGMLLLSFLIIIWGSDVGAYLFGMSLGQKYGRKLCPSISPHKSWIGFWGGLVFAILSALTLHWTGMLDIPAVHSVLLACVMHVGGVVGDLYESQWKRHFGVKDSGNIIPGHGGLLDRFDSTLVAMPLGALFLALFNLI